MGKRSLSPGVRCQRVQISATPVQIGRWDRRAKEERRYGRAANATRSGVIRLDGNAAQRLRHDLRTPLSGLTMLGYALRHGAVDAAEAARRLDGLVEEIVALVAAEE